MILNTEQLAAVRERVEKATPGKMWTGCGLGIYRRGRDNMVDWNAFEVEHEIVEEDRINTRIRFKRVEDGYFYSEARTDVPALLDTVEALREALEFYADKANYIPPLLEVYANGEGVYGSPPVKNDEGAKARQALASLSPQGQKEGERG